MDEKKKEYFDKFMKLYSMIDKEEQEQVINNIAMIRNNTKGSSILYWQEKNGSYLLGNMQKFCSLMDALRTLYVYENIEKIYYFECLDEYMIIVFVMTMYLYFKMKYVNYGSNFFYTDDILQFCMSVGLDVLPKSFDSEFFTLLQKKYLESLKNKKKKENFEETYKKLLHVPFIGMEIEEL